MMIYICALLFGLLGGSVVHADPDVNRLNLEKVESEEELQNLRVYLRRINQDPKLTAEEFAIWFTEVAGPERSVTSADWERKYQVELKTLDLLAYYVELEHARAQETELPTHSLFEQHHQFYADVLHTTQHLNRLKVVLPKADTFARYLLFQLESEQERLQYFEHEQHEHGPRVLLYRKLLSAGRAFWVEHIVQDVFIDTIPDTGLMIKLIPYFPDWAFEDVARAISGHRQDSDHVQKAMNLLVAGRVLRSRPLPEHLGNRHCAQMLARAMKFEPDPDDQNNED